MKPYCALVLSFLISLLVGCATTRSTFFTGRPQVCQEFLELLDQKVEDAGVRNASSIPVHRFPYLRTNRFLTTLGKNLEEASEQKQWVQLMQDRDLEARQKEISTLPDSAIHSFGSEGNDHQDREGLYTQAESCSNELLNHDIRSPDFFNVLSKRVKFPDEYSLLRRTIGLYPLFSIPVAVVTARSREKSRDWFKTDLNSLPVEGSLVSFVPPEEIIISQEEIEEILKNGVKNPLKIPLLDEDQERKLIAHFAPVFVQDVVGPFDQIGGIVWKNDKVALDPAVPIVYYYTSHSLLKGEPVLQINYVIWYSETGGKNTPWLERGYLDGLTIRVSLGTHGKPFMLEVLKNCGCYQIFVPQKERVQKTVSRRLKPDFLVAQWLPAVLPGQRLGVRVSSGWHQLERVYAVEAPPDLYYQFVPYEVLEALPYDGERKKSMFNSKGVVEDSERGREEILFFSMGIPSVASMRQRGRHPCELVGRVHCDDPELFDKYFELK